MNAPAGPPTVLWQLGDVPVVSRAAAGLLVLNMLPVVTLTIGSALLMWLVSLATAPPQPATLARYFQHA